MPSQKLFVLEKEIASLILEKLQHLEITPQRAAEIARFTLKALPSNLTDEQVDKVLPTLDDQYYELASIVHAHLSTFEEGNRDKTAQEAEKLIHEGKLAEANQLMTQYFSTKPL